jgi:tetratricopeptide (TPR) repeat protein
MEVAYDEGIEILRKLTTANPDNTRWQRNLAGALKKAGDQKYALGNAEEALPLYEEAVAIRRRLVELDPANLHWRLELLTTLEGVTRTAVGDRRIEAATAALALLEELRRNGSLPAEQSDWDGMLRAMLE